MPFAYSNVIQAGLPVLSFVSMANIALSFPFEERVYNSLVVREPIGVAVAIDVRLLQDMALPVRDQPQGFVVDVEDALPRVPWAFLPA